MNDGGPAFPIPAVGTGDPRDGMSTGCEGMSLRDWFAGMALQGNIASETQEQHYDRTCVGHKRCAEDCYKFADAMLKAREVSND